LSSGLKWVCRLKIKSKKAARCKQVAVIAYGSQVDEWWKRNPKIKTLENVEVWQISAESSAQLEQLSQRTMQLQLNVMDGEWTLIGDQAQVVIQWTQLQGL
jgi:uncharacterized protein YaeQ